MPYTFTREPREVTSSSRVQTSQIDPEWAKALEDEWQAHLANPEIMHVIDLGDPKVVTRHAAHARAWGLSRKVGEDETKVNVRKLPARNGDKDSLLRLTMEKYDPNAPKLGRKAKPAATAETAEAPKTPETENVPEVPKTPEAHHAPEGHKPAETSKRR